MNSVSDSGSVDEFCNFPAVFCILNCFWNLLQLWFAHFTGFLAAKAHEYDSTKPNWQKNMITQKVKISKTDGQNI